ncbi:MAG: NTP transferase domain-containing protein [Chlorobiaceae bacterium]|nr:NTP transferase domain-containing protein [Chlorobiaceae bacterium]NTW10086.1 NTP transferase domain-containing protein [Chlorobiaceae bacterium]
MDGVGNSHVYAVIMAGGTGKTLWPSSRKKTPKQFAPLFDGESMISGTVRRIRSIVPEERVVIVTNPAGKIQLERSLAGFPPANVIVEPGNRKTAPCIALATAYIKKRDPEAITVVLPSDHLVHDERAFTEILREGISIAAEKKGLVTIGVKPRSPETDYGYIQAAEELPPSRPFSHGFDFKLYRVKAFAEKPDYHTALQFLESRDFFWNSGVFIWHIDAISREFERSLPDLYKDMLHIYDNIGTERERKVIEDVYSWIHPISIDYGIMEKAENVFVIEGDFGWSDLGNWDEVMKASLEREKGSERIRGEKQVIIASENLFIRRPEGKMVCVIGVRDLIIVDTGDALLVCAKGESHRVGEAVDELRRENLEEFL